MSMRGLTRSADDDGLADVTNYRSMIGEGSMGIPCFVLVVVWKIFPSRT
jgi:hypothetical protein